MKKSLFVSVAFLLSACGGGGDGGVSAPVASSEVFQIANAWTNRLNTTESSNFTLSGQVGEVRVTGSGTATRGALTATTFESLAASRKTTVVTGTISANGNSAPFGGTTSIFVDSGNQYRGSSSDDDYCVIAGAFQLPQTARVNDTGIIYTENCYTNSSKSISVGTQVASYALRPETSTTAFLDLILTEKSVGGQVQSTAIVTYRVSPNGSIQSISEQYSDADSSFTLKY